MSLGTDRGRPLDGSGSPEDGLKHRSREVAMPDDLRVSSRVSAGPSFKTAVVAEEAEEGRRALLVPRPARQVR